MTITEKQLIAFFGGFDLGGYRQSDGSILAGEFDGEVLEDWPDEITVFGHTYTLEQIITGEDGWENALYV